MVLTRSQSRREKRDLITVPKDLITEPKDNIGEKSSGEKSKGGKSSLNVSKTGFYF